MPLDSDGTYIPRKRPKLTGPLFHLDPATLPTQEYRRLVTEVADFMCFILEQVNWNYSETVSYKFEGRQVDELRDRLNRIHRFPGITLKPEKLNSHVGSLLKQKGLIRHSSEPGTRKNWPWVPHIPTRDKLQAIVDDAFHGHH